MTEEKAHYIATMYAEDKMIDYMEYADMDDYAEQYASNEVYDKSYNYKMEQLRLNFDIVESE